MNTGWHVTASDIQHWTATKNREAAGFLPLLVQKLVSASCKPIQIHFPSRDSISIGDYDGYVEVKEGNEFVPTGKSVWEISTQQSAKKKFDGDLKKRMLKPNAINKKNTSIVFVTSRTWREKRVWCDNNNRKKSWKKIYGLNAVDIENWLNQCPSVHSWFATIIGNRVAGVIDINQAMETWLNGTKIKLTTDILLSGREKHIDELKTLLNSKACKVQIVAPSKSEALSFCVAVIKNEDNFVNKGLLVKSQSQWDQMIVSKNPLILLADNFIPNNIGQAINNGHHVIIPLDSSEPHNQNEGIKLERLSHDGIIGALNTAGFDLEKAETIYRNTRGYLCQIRQHKFLQPLEFVVPSWVTDIDNDILLAILMANEWDTKKEKDKEVLAKLSGYEYVELEKKLNILATSPDAPIRIVSTFWQVISKVNLWSYVSSKISKQLIERIESVIFNVLGEQNPSFDLQLEDRWLASIRTKESDYSGKLKNGLADSLALLSMYGDKSSKLLGDINLETKISYWVKKLLEKNDHAKGWYSYGENIIALAEAAPQSFLEILEKNVSQVNPSIAELFIQETTFGGCPHSFLLWALESLSWNKDYLPKVVALLSRLSEIDKGSKYANRPFNSLTEIFVGWVNNTSATHVERIEIIKSVLLKENEEISWKLLLNLLPDYRGVSSPINKPVYQRWSDGILRSVNITEYWNYEYSVMDILLEIFRSNPIKRIIDVIENITRLSGKYFDSCIDILTTIIADELCIDERLVICDKLRDIINRNRQFHYTEWALPESAVDKLEQVFLHFNTNDPIEKNKYLFDSDHPDLLNPLVEVNEGDINFEAELKEIQRLRIEAINSIYNENDIDGIKKIIQECNRPEYVGYTIVDAQKYQEIESVILSWLEEENKNLVTAAKAYIYKTNYNDAESLPKIIQESHNWSNKKMKNFLLGLPFNSKTFDLLEKQNNEVKEQYWSSVNQYILFNDDLEKINYVVENLLINKRPLAAVDAAAKMFYGKRPITLDCNLLTLVLTEIATNPSDKDSIHLSMVKHDILLSIEYLQKSESSDKAKLAQIEWMFINFFHMEKQRPVTLEKEIQNNPKFFAELISWCFKSEEDDDEKTDIDEQALISRAENAFELLRRISKIPGEQSDGSIDKDFLLKWVINARGELQKINRGKIGDDRMGNYLSNCSRGTDGVWPHEAVRNIIEQIKSIEFDRGIECGRFNSRGITWRNPYDGGDQERILAEKYLEDSDKIKLRWPRTAIILRSLGDSYKHDAKREDDRVELD